MGTKIHKKSIKMRSWALWAALGARVGSRNAISPYVFFSTFWSKFIFAGKYSILYDFLKKVIVLKGVHTVLRATFSGVARLLTPPKSIFFRGRWEV